MEPQKPEKGAPDKRERQLKKSVHRCPRCAHTIDLKSLSMRESITGLITCQKCEWSGPIVIGVAVKEQ
jgi:transcription elongation factor Elf1